MVVIASLSLSFFCCSTGDNGVNSMSIMVLRISDDKDDYTDMTGMLIMVVVMQQMSYHYKNNYGNDVSSSISCLLSSQDCLSPYLFASQRIIRSRTALGTKEVRYS